MNFWSVTNVQKYYNCINLSYQLSRNFMPCCARSITGPLPIAIFVFYNRNESFIVVTLFGRIRVRSITGMSVSDTSDYFLRRKIDILQ